MNWAKESLLQMPFYYFVTEMEHGKKIAKIVLCFEHNYIRSSNFLCGNFYVIQNNSDSFAIELRVSDITACRRSNKIAVRLI